MARQGEVFKIEGVRSGPASKAKAQTDGSRGILITVVWAKYWPPPAGVAEHLPSTCRAPSAEEIAHKNCIFTVYFSTSFIYKECYHCLPAGYAVYFRRT